MQGLPLSQQISWGSLDVNVVLTTIFSGATAAVFVLNWVVPQTKQLVDARRALCSGHKDVLTTVSFVPPQFHFAMSEVANADDNSVFGYFWVNFIATTFKEHVMKNIILGTFHTDSDTARVAVVSVRGIYPSLADHDSMSASDVSSNTNPVCVDLLPDPQFDQYQFSTGW